MYERWSDYISVLNIILMKKYFVYRLPVSPGAARGAAGGSCLAAWTAECDGLLSDRSLEFSVCTVNVVVVVVVVKQNITKCHAVITFH